MLYSSVGGRSEAQDLLWVGVTGTGYRRSLLERREQTYNFVTNEFRH
jgi:hypothetical protein